MKYFIIVLVLIIFCSKVQSQNLILNGGFEKYWGPDCSSGFSITPNDVFNGPPPFDCHIRDWIRISETPDGYWYKGYDFPTNWLSHYVLPHSDSVCVGEAFYIQSMPNIREIIQGKLTKPLITNHHYQFSMYVQLFDSIPWAGVGQIAGINSFSALFTDTAITSVTDLPIQNYHPQIQIDSMVIDTQHWILLVDTFVAAGGEQYVSIGNFKQDGQFQSKVVQTIIPNSAKVTYYYMDDVSLIDLDEVGIEEIEKNKLVVYPNPTTNELRIKIDDIQLKKIEVLDVLNRKQDIIYSTMNNQYLIDTSLLERGIYFIKATDINGNVSIGKFVKD
ncbi:MAG: hypothetical protein RJA07_948 [Bacteroidota bacterium]|jgi:hypothetical protein